ncbi:DUF4255 domain-containing protein [Coleofasciculus sp. E1-EBD-02]|uniref:DUF4255 domain-containing protein n=1 Tax=Coleofasciculus sp. E1-EBD-02 TaxID=3068481 RepID=UPI00330250FB
MSNSLAIATVTATLQRIVQTSIQDDISGATVTTLRPNEVGTATPQVGVNVFLYQVQINHAWRQQAEVQARSRRNPGAKRSQTALDLHYMISFYGNDNDLQPQRLMGSVMGGLNDWRTLKKERIERTLHDSTYSYLLESDLPDQIQEISLWPLDLSLEDLSKAWSAFFQTTYLLSVAYRARVIMLEGQDTGSRPLPVRARSLDGIVPFTNQPKIDRIISQAGRLEPILADSTVLIQGNHLKSDITQVWIGEMEVTPSEITDTQIVLPLSSIPTDSLQAGMHSLQVVHRLAKVMPPTSSNGNGASQPSGNGGQMQTVNQPQTFVSSIQSNVSPLVIRPTITKTTVSKKAVDDEDLRSAEIRVRSNLTVGKKQRVLLALNEIDTNQPAAYLFEASPRQTDVIWVSFPVERMKGGRYLVRLLVDGAESPLIVDTEPDSPTFNQYVGPRISI